MVMVLLAVVAPLISAAALFCNTVALQELCVTMTQLQYYNNYYAH